MKAIINYVLAILTFTIFAAPMGAIAASSDYTFTFTPLDIGTKYITPQVTYQSLAQQDGTQYHRLQEGITGAIVLSTRYGSCTVSLTYQGIASAPKYKITYGAMGQQL